MPFTVSHVVAVLPLTAGRPRRVLIPAALVIGSMVPDLPYFVPPHVGAEWSHSALGPVTTDLALGLGVFALWQLVLVAPLSDLAPRWLRTRLPARRQLTIAGWLWAALSVVIGATTHVVWDTFTHRNSWGTRHVNWLSDVHAGLPGFKWFQYGSGVIGVMILLLWLTLWLHRAIPDGVAVTSAGRRAQLVAWITIAAVFVGSVAMTWLSGVQRTDKWLDEAAAFQIATRTTTFTAAAVVVLCLTWHLWHRLWSLMRSPPQPSGIRSRSDRLMGWPVWSLCQIAAARVVSNSRPK